MARKPILEKLTGKRSKLSYSGWRPSDQKVFVADISAARKALGWVPKVSPEEGVGRLVEWAKANLNLFS